MYVYIHNIIWYIICQYNTIYYINILPSHTPNTSPANRSADPTGQCFWGFRSCQQTGLPSSGRKYGNSFPGKKMALDTWAVDFLNHFSGRLGDVFVGTNATMDRNCRMQLAWDLATHCKGGATLTSTSSTSNVFVPMKPIRNNKCNIVQFVNASLYSKFLPLVVAQLEPSPTDRCVYEPPPV